MSLGLAWADTTLHLVGADTRAPRATPVILSSAFYLCCSSSVLSYRTPSALYSRTLISVSIYSRTVAVVKLSLSTPYLTTMTIVIAKDAKQVTHVH